MEFTELIREAQRIDAAHRERIVRGLLEHWVSGLEPAIAVGPNYEIMGLCDAAAPIGSSPWIYSVDKLGTR